MRSKTLLSLNLTGTIKLILMVAALAGFCKKLQESLMKDHNSLLRHPPIDRVVLRRRALALALTLCFVSKAMGDQISKRCLDGASLWMPQETTPAEPVTKWGNAIGYEITAGASSANITTLIERSLRFQSQESGLRISPGSGLNVDLLIAVLPDISALASPAARKSMANYFQDFYRKSSMQGTFEIDAASWDASFRNIVPKCLGSSLISQHVVERSIFAVQQDQSALCVDIGLGEVLGLHNIRRYYFDNNLDVPSDLVAEGLRTLYDKRIVPGMSRSDAWTRLEEICHG